MQKPWHDRATRPSPACGASRDQKSVRWSDFPEEGLESYARKAGGDSRKGGAPRTEPLFATRHSLLAPSPPNKIYPHPPQPALSSPCPPHRSEIMTSGWCGGGRVRSGSLRRRPKALRERPVRRSSRYDAPEGNVEPSEGRRLPATWRPGLPNGGESRRRKAMRAPLAWQGGQRRVARVASPPIVLAMRQGMRPARNAIRPKPRSAGEARASFTCGLPARGSSLAGPASPARWAGVTGKLRSSRAVGSTGMGRGTISPHPPSPACGASRDQKSLRWSDFPEEGLESYARKAGGDSRKGGAPRAIAAKHNLFTKSPWSRGTNPTSVQAAPPSTGFAGPPPP